MWDSIPKNLVFDLWSIFSDSNEEECVKERYPHSEVTIQLALENARPSEQQLSSGQRFATHVHGDRQTQSTSSKALTIECHENISLRPYSAASSYVTMDTPQVYARS